MHHATLDALIKQAGSIYEAWINGNVSTAQAMLHQVPPDRISYVTMTMTVLAFKERQLYQFTKFIEGQPATRCHLVLCTEYTTDDTPWSDGIPTQGTTDYGDIHCLAAGLRSLQHGAF
jgi:hypothetical protein